MPLYEYECDVCAHRFEVIQKFSDEKIKVCPKCGSPVSKLLSSPAIQFKGSGWYITDYAKSGKTDSGNVAAGKAEKAEKGDKSEKSDKVDSSASSSPKSESTSEAKTDSTPAAKTETKSEAKADAKPASGTT